MNPETCFLIATRLEAKPILSSKLWHECDEVCGLKRYRSGNADLVIIGVGPTRSAIACGWLLSQNYKTWVNLGVAGALSDKYTFCDITTVKICLSRDEYHPFDRKEDELNLCDKGVRLLTVGRAIHDDRDKMLCSEKADLVDMEGYSIAMAAKSGGIDLEMVKIVSDDASSKSMSDVVKNIPICMQKLWNEVEYDI